MIMLMQMTEFLTDINYQPKQVKTWHTFTLKNKYKPYNQSLQMGRSIAQKKNQREYYPSAYDVSAYLQNHFKVNRGYFVYEKPIPYLLLNSSIVKSLMLPYVHQKINHFLPVKQSSKHQYASKSHHMSNGPGNQIGNLQKEGQAVEKDFWMQVNIHMLESNCRDTNSHHEDVYIRTAHEA